MLCPTALTPPIAVYWIDFTVDAPSALATSFRSAPALWTDTASGEASRIARSRPGNLSMRFSLGKSRGRDCSIRHRQDWRRRGGQDGDHVRDPDGCSSFRSETKAAAVPHGTGPTQRGRLVQPP